MAKFVFIKDQNNAPYKIAGSPSMSFKAGQVIDATLNNCGVKNINGRSFYSCEILYNRNYMINTNVLQILEGTQQERDALKRLHPSILRTLMPDYYNRTYGIPQKPQAIPIGTVNQQEIEELKRQNEILKQQVEEVNQNTQTEEVKTDELKNQTGDSSVISGFMSNTNFNKILMVAGVAVVLLFVIRNVSSVKSIIK